MLGLITDSVIEDFLVVLEQAFNPSNVVVAVSGLDAEVEARGVLVSLARCARLSQEFPGLGPSGWIGLYSNLLREVRSKETSTSCLRDQSTALFRMFTKHTVRL